MSSDRNEDIQLERKIESVVVRISLSKEETPLDGFIRLNSICDVIEKEEEKKKRELWREEVSPDVEKTLIQIRKHFNLTTNDFTKTGINRDYPRVLLSLLWNFDQSMRATDVSKEWGGINTGIVSRVFRGSKESTIEYKGHFEEYGKHKYRFSRKGLDYALSHGMMDILDEKQEPLGIEIV
jgi:hypothetical protein